MTFSRSGHSSGSVRSTSTNRTKSISPISGCLAASSAVFLCFFHYEKSAACGGARSWVSLRALFLPVSVEVTAPLRRVRFVDAMTCLDCAELVYPGFHPQHCPRKVEMDPFPTTRQTRSAILQETDPRFSEAGLCPEHDGCSLGLVHEHHGELVARDLHSHKLPRVASEEAGNRFHFSSGVKDRPHGHSCFTERSRNENFNSRLVLHEPLQKKMSNSLTF